MGRVAVVKTKPESILEDTQEVMQLADFESVLPKDFTTGLKINISWQTWYPACSSAPWQIEGAIFALKNAGYKNIVGVHNDTVVVDTKVGEFNNKHRYVTDKHNIPCIYLYEEDFEWFEYKPKEPLLVLDKVYPEGIFIPRALVDMNIIHLPTVKTHVFTTITGAMKNAFGGLLHRNRHWTHGVIHDTLVDLLTIQKEIHPGIFALMDGTFAGDGPGPRAMRWHQKDILLASADQVAIDAVSAKLQGFDPMSLRFIRKAHEKGLGIGDPKQIEIVGYDIEQEPNWGFRREDTFASRGQKLIYHGFLQPLEHLLLRTPIVPWSYFASNFYHNVYWYPFVGRKRVEAALQNPWGKLFESYGNGEVVMPGMEPKTVLQTVAGITIAAATAIGGFLLLRRRK
jgi:uncharacterized protein (DUF362 family)